jgi:hypothetical protein
VKIITTTHFRRPEYTARVLAALKSCQGIADYQLLPLVDRAQRLQDREANEQVIALIEAIDFCESKPLIASYNLGCSRAIYMTLERGFAAASFVIQIEDDIELSPDGLKFFEFFEGLRWDPSVFTLSAYRQTTEPDADPQRALRTPWFFPWGWATWIDRWEEMRRSWHWQFWDTGVCHNTRSGRLVIHPHLSRAQNIGAEGGEQVPDAAFHQRFHHSPHVALEPQSKWQLDEQITPYGAPHG